MTGKLKEEMSKSFDMKNLGPTCQISHMQVRNDRNGKKLKLSQDKYVEYF